MPDVTFTVSFSLWWVVVLAAYPIYIFTVARPLYALIRKKYMRGSVVPNWVSNVGYVLAGPIGWFGAVYDFIQKRNRKRREAV